MAKLTGPLDFSSAAPSVQPKRLKQRFFDTQTATGYEV
jgi:hypothetical protein